MSDEMLALHHFDTCELAPLPTDKSVVGCRWFYTVKVRPVATFEKFKA